MPTVVKRRAFLLPFHGLEPAVGGKEQKIISAGSAKGV
nr:MAG TPA: hypothetical protein [Caudoviricetes sp.]